MILLVAGGGLAVAVSVLLVASMLSKRHQASQLSGAEYAGDASLLSPPAGSQKPADLDHGERAPDAFYMATGVDADLAEVQTDRAPRKVVGGRLFRVEPLRSILQVERGTAVTVETFRKAGTSWESIKFPAQIVACTSMHVHLHAESPQIQLKRGTPVRMAFRREGDASYGYYSFVADESDRVRLRIERGGRLLRNQDRDLVRAPVGRMIAFEHVAARDVSSAMQNGDLTGLEMSVAHGLLLDISGGGVSIRSATPFETDDLVRLRFDGLQPEIFEGSAQHVVGRVVGCSPQAVDGDDQWICRVEFVQITEEVRRCIVQYVNRKLIGREPL